jgi:hypothetical protein
MGTGKLTILVPLLHLTFPDEIRRLSCRNSNGQPWREESHFQSRVSRRVARWINGAANKTIGTISAHEASHASSQLITKAPSAKKRRFATADATAVVTPD